jgi:two-component system chemotaxis response regulator CheY
VNAPLRLFICDDNREYRSLARMVLEMAGHEIVGEAGDGEEAIAQAPATAPEVVLLDLNMPNMNGFEALPHLRERLPSTKILILTTGQAPKERQLALESGADGYIVKPTRVFSLDEEIQAALAA